MPVCPECDTAVSDASARCPECGALVRMNEGPIPEPLQGADVPPEEEQEWFEKRFGIDIGDQSILEYLNYLEQQDFALSLWFWLFAMAELAGIVVFVVNMWGPPLPEIIFWYGYTAISVLLAIGIFGDTRLVGQFRPGSKTRWVYVLLAAIPVLGHVTGFLYATYRRLKHEETVRERRRLLDAGFDIQSGPRQPAN